MKNHTVIATLILGLATTNALAFDGAKPDKYTCVISGAQTAPFAYEHDGAIALPLTAVAEYEHDGAVALPVTAVVEFEHDGAVALPVTAVAEYEHDGAIALPVTAVVEYEHDGAVATDGEKSKKPASITARLAQIFGNDVGKQATQN